ncbi:MAG: 50S ribosomal protein L15 [Cyclobacteriaceae bacterium]|nr:50S ribosomal protein L15 [Cyclobacteriaceae bacterium]
MKLHTLMPAEGATKTTKRIGRGEGTGRGGTATKGHKGAQSRSGYSSKSGFEGGQMPLQRRVPKFGFNNKFRVAYKGVNIDTLQELSEKINSDVIDLQVLLDNGVIGKKDLVKILGRGELTKKLTVTAHAFTASAVAAIEKSGGSISKL